MKIRHAVCLLGLISLTSQPSQAQEKTSEGYRLDGKKIELAHYAKAFVGQGNVTVEIAPYKKGNEEGALLLFKGIESAWDGKAINHRVRPAAYGGQDYVTTYKDKDWVTLNTRKYDEGKPTYELNVPDVKETLSLVPSDGAAQMTNPRAIFQVYQDQHKSKGTAK